MGGIICAGVIAADLVFEVDAFPVQGAKTRAATSRMLTGGGGLNAASAIAALGGAVSLCGSIGDDDLGLFLRRKMAERGIDDRFVRTMPGMATSRSANLITPDGDRTIINHRDAGLLSALPDLPSGFPFEAALVDTRWPEAAAMIMRAAREAGKPGVIDGEAPVMVAQSALEAASHVVFSEQGLADYCGGSGAEALAEAARALGRWCAVTRGGAPVLCHDGTKLTEVPGFPTEAMNTLGAGDVWHGAFTLALARGRPEPEAARWANAAASLKVRRSIDVEVSPTGAEVEALLAEAPDRTD